jgi:hypothetical protein
MEEMERAFEEVWGDAFLQPFQEKVKVIRE